MAMNPTIATIFAPIFLIGVVHIIGGISVLIAPDASLVSGLAGLRGIPPIPLGIMLIIVGGLAIYGKFSGMPKYPYCIWVVPQQIILFLQLWGVALAMVAGQYPDGYVPVPESYWRSLWFIISDQAPLIMFALSHTIELLLASRLRSPQVYWYEQYLHEQAARIEAQRASGLVKDTRFWSDASW